MSLRGHHKRKRGNKVRSDSGLLLFKHSFLVLLAIIFVFAIFGDKGLFEVYRLRGERVSMMERNGIIEAENSEFREKIRLLETDNRYIEKVARRELGMIRSDEVLYKIEE